MFNRLVLSAIFVFFFTVEAVASITLTPRQITILQKISNHEMAYSQGVYEEFWGQMNPAVYSDESTFINTIAGLEATILPSEFQLEFWKSKKLTIHNKKKTYSQKYKVLLDVFTQIGDKNHSVNQDMRDNLQDFEIQLNTIAARAKAGASMKVDLELINAFISYKERVQNNLKKLIRPPKDIKFKN